MTDPVDEARQRLEHDLLCQAADAATAPAGDPITRALERLDRTTRDGLIVREAVLPDRTHPAVRERLAELAALPAPDELPRTPTPTRAQRRAALRLAQAADRRARRAAKRAVGPTPPDEAA